MHATAFLQRDFFPTGHPPVVPLLSLSLASEQGDYQITTAWFVVDLHLDCLSKRECVRLCVHVFSIRVLVVRLH